MSFEEFKENITIDELEGMYVEVYTMLGSCIYSSQSTSLNTQLSIENRGLYIVRVIAGNGTIYQGKIIVKQYVSVFIKKSLLLDKNFILCLQNEVFLLLFYRENCY